MDRQQQKKLIHLLLQIPGINSSQTRETLLLGIPNAGNLNRDESNPRNDITLLVDQLTRLRLQTGEHALLALLDNALPRVKGFTLETELQELRQSLQSSLEEAVEESPKAEQARVAIAPTKTISKPVTSNPSEPSIVPAPPPAYRNNAVHQRWSAGKPVLIGKRIYLLGECTEDPQTPQSRLYVWRQASARLDPAYVSGGENYRIKQVAFQSVRLSMDQQQCFVEILSNEAALLCELYRAKEKHFPRYIDFNDREPEWATLIFTATAGKALAAIYGLPQEPGVESRPISSQHARLLLESVPALCTMLAALHRRNMAHRDLTPKTLLHVNDGQGSRLVLRDLGRATHPKACEGHPDYAAPEQQQALDHADIGPATDVYQLGAVLYRLLCGKAPDRTSWGVEPPSIVAPHLPEALNDILLKSLAVDYRERWSSIKAFGAALRDAASLIKLK